MIASEDRAIPLLRQADLMNQISESHGKIFLRSQAKSAADLILDSRTITQFCR